MVVPPSKHGECLNLSTSPGHTSDIITVIMVTMRMVVVAVAVAVGIECVDKEGPADS